MAGLITLAEAKTHLNVTDSTWDSELQDFVDVASDLVEKEAGRVWRDTTFTEYHKGGTSDVVLFHSPVLSVTSVTDWGTVIDPSDYILYSATGRIHLPYYQFVGGPGQVVVVYHAGAATVPYLVKQATKETVRHLWKTQRGAMGVRNPLNGDDPDPGSTFSLPHRAAELLARLMFPGGIG